MNKWILAAELFSLILLIILMLNFYERRWKDFPKRKIYHFCLITSVCSILLNMFCVHLIEWAEEIPLLFNILFNSAYFLLILLVSSSIAYYMMFLLYEHIYEKSGLRMFRRLLVALYTAYVILILYNIKSGVVFYFDDHMVYKRGPLVNSGYVIMGIQLLVLIIFTARNVRSISTSMLRVMRILPPGIVLLTIYQLIYPDILLNGGILVAANIILFVNFQNYRIEQDTLTSSGNRKSFIQELKLRTGGGQKFQIIVVSIHKFGSVNHRYGNEKGDELLYFIAKWLENVCVSGTSFRVGNVEFALLVPFKNKEEADRLLYMVYRRFHEPWTVGDVNVVLDSTFADLVCADSKWDATDITEFLNFSLSIAKTKKDRIVRFDENAFKTMEYRSKIIKRMQHSAAKDLFQVWFQPIYQCSTGRYHMAEALVRMTDEEGKQVSPSVFIPLAEQHGLIEEISRVVLHETCRLLSEPASSELYSISVNLSMQQFMSMELIDNIKGLIDQYHFDPGRLKLELTERVLSEDIPQMHYVMTELNKMGIRFALDDFGTGYSNLSTVLLHSFSCIKLDRSLIQKKEYEEKSVSVVAGLLDLFHQIGCEVVAEGVENAETAEQLIRQGADWIQGFYYARPVPEKEFLEIICAEPQTGV